MSAEREQRRRAAAKAMNQWLRSQAGRNRLDVEQASMEELEQELERRRREQEAAPAGLPAAGMPDIDASAGRDQERVRPLTMNDLIRRARDASRL